MKKMTQLVPHMIIHLKLLLNFLLFAKQVSNNKKTLYRFIDFMHHQKYLIEPFYNARRLEFKPHRTSPDFCTKDTMFWNENLTATSWFKTAPNNITRYPSTKHFLWSKDNKQYCLKLYIN